MALIGLHFYAGKPAWAVEDLVRRLHVPPDVIKEFLSTFTQSHLLVITADETSYLPARDLEQIGIKQILDAIRGNKDGQGIAGEPDEGAGVDELIREVDHSIAAALRGKSLKSLVLSKSTPESDRD